MAALFWFLLGLWVGGTAGFVLFACLQVSRDSERADDTAPRRELSPSQLAAITLEIERIKALAASNGRVGEWA